LCVAPLDAAETTGTARHARGVEQSALHRVPLLVFFLRQPAA
jgi:hypothetical protein